MDGLQAKQADAQTRRETGSAVSLTIIVPTRNESGNIGPLLQRLAAALSDVAAEVVFVDDSTDSTLEVIQAQAEVCPLAVRLIARPQERRNGLSGAVIEGIAAARGTWACVIDADLQHPPETIRRLLTQAERTGADIVVASREADMLGPLGLSRARALTSQVLTILARMLFPRVLKNVSDPLTGFFMFRRAAIDTTVLKPTGFKILLEILVRHPDLHVTELHFDFAPRQAGQSKADLNEGLRFFRHVTRLRMTVNQHLPRFLLLLAAAVGLNLVGLIALVRGAGWPLAGAALLAGGLTLAFVLVGEAWVFSDRPRGPTRRRLLLVLVLGALIILLIYVPVILLLARIGLPYWLAAAFGILATGFVYYLLSEQWIWTRGLMMRPRDSYYYVIHDILAISSQVRLDDLGTFEVTDKPERTDLHLRVDRHGIPSRVPSAICYDEQLGRFGFGLTVLPGNFTEIVVSPMLETSQDFLFTNIVEPVLRWMFVSRGFVLARAAAVGGPGAAVPDDVLPEAGATPYGLLLAGLRDEQGYATGRVCRDSGMAFLGDDRVILGRDGVVYPFPKLITINRETARVELSGRPAALSSSVTLLPLRLIYSRPVRSLGLRLGRALPAATINTYLQRLFPQPKYPVTELGSGIRLSGPVPLAAAIIIEQGGDGLVTAAPDDLITAISGNDVAAASFQPQPLLLGQLGRWGGNDWWAIEQGLLQQALATCSLLRWSVASDRWWEQFGQVLQQTKAH